MTHDLDIIAPGIPDAVHRRQVEAMAAYGIPEREIARVLGIDPEVLRSHYAEELDTGQTKANSKVAESLYRKAIGDGHQAVTAAIFWLKTQARWKEVSVNEISGPEGTPLTHQIVVRFVNRGEDVHALERG